MKKSILLLLFVVTILSSCKRANTTVALLSGKYTGFDQPLTFYVRAHGNELTFSLPTYIDTLVTAADGSFSLKFDLKESKELLLECKSPDGNGTIYQSVFLEPDDSIYFESDGKYGSSVKNLRGKGSNKLTVMHYTRNLISSSGFHKIIGKKDSIQLMREFKLRLKKYDALTDSIKPIFSPAFTNFILANKLQETAYFLQILPTYLEVYGYPTFAVDSVARDSAYTAMYSFSAEGYKNFNFADQLYQVLLSSLPKTDSVAKRIDSYMDHVDALPLPIEGKQLMVSKGILHFLSRGKVKEIEPTLNDFYAHHPTSVFTKTLKAQFLEWSALSPGMPAPDFAAMKMDGTPFKLSDLKGKVAYIDIWATWCGPCRAEFTHSTEIKKHYKSNSNIIFLYVSVDGEKETWMKYLDENPGFEGLHVNDPGDFRSAIAKMYKVNGIPRYLIVDRQGKIFSTNAHRPSDAKKLIEQLDKALTL